MATKKLSDKGEEAIKAIVNGSGNSYLSGSAKDKVGYDGNLTAILPHCYPKTDVNYVWTSNPAINSGIETNDQLAEALILWYNEYAGELDAGGFELDANIMVAQAIQESGLKIWNYAVNSSASGISQYIADTVYSSIIRNPRGTFTNDELRALTVNMIGYTHQDDVIPDDIAPFSVSTIAKDYLGQRNRPILHQNIIDNPKIMIKAQFDYMKSIGKKCDNVASCALFGYNRGPGYLRGSSYSKAITVASNVKTDYENEGIKYVYNIFKNLYDNFGYKHLNMTKEAEKSFEPKYTPNLG